MEDEQNISVLIPVWNGAEFLAEAVESALTQGDRLREIVILDDGSTDETPTIARRFGPPVRYERREHAGLPATRNEGVRLARGDLLAFLDADDVWPSGRIEALRAALARRPEAQIVQGRLQRLARRPTGAWYLLDEAHRAPNLGTGLIRRSAFDILGGFDEAFPGGHDVDWLLRAREAGFVETTIDEITLHYRRHEGNMTNDTAVDQAHLLRVLRRSIDRRRAAVRGPAS